MHLTLQMMINELSRAQTGRGLESEFGEDSFPRLDARKGAEKQEFLKIHSQTSLVTSSDAFIERLAIVLVELSLLSRDDFMQIKPK